MKTKFVSPLPLLLCVVFVGLLGRKDASAQTVTVKLLNGKNGKPLPHIRVYIILGGPNNQSVLDLKTDLRGEVAFEVKAAKTLQVRPIGTVDCNEVAHDRDRSTDEVLNLGLVTTNHCGTHKPEPVRGHIRIPRSLCTGGLSWRDSL